MMGNILKIAIDKSIVIDGIYKSFGYLAVAIGEGGQVELPVQVVLQ